MQHSKPRYPLVEGLKLLGLSRAKGYVRIREGRLHPIYDGGTPFLTATEIDRYAGQTHPLSLYVSKKSRNRSTGRGSTA